jgi:hypothetical protein
MANDTTWAICTPFYFSWSFVLLGVFFSHDSLVLTDIVQVNLTKNFAPPLPRFFCFLGTNCRFATPTASDSSHFNSKKKAHFKRGF